MRVYELAKKLGMENRELIPELKRLGISVASHSSALDEPSVQRVMEHLAPGGESSRKAGTVAGEGEENKKPGWHSRTAGGQHDPSLSRSAGKPSKAPVGVAADPPKPEKRRILIKRKKTEEELAAEASAAAIDSAAPAPASSSLAVPASPETTKTAHPLEPPPREVASGPASVEVPASLVSPSPPSGAAEPSLPLPSPPQPTGRQEPQLLRLDKKRGITLEPPQGEAAALKDKLKKVKKPGRSRDQEDVRSREDVTRWQDLRAIPVHRREDRARHGQPSSVTEITKPRKKVIKLIPGLTVKEFAALVGQRPVDIIRRLMETGQMLTMNQLVDPDAALLIAEGLGLKAEVALEKHGEDLLEEIAAEQQEEALEVKPPVVTIMGHVDHGKTSLLDAIRQTKVTEQEAGGITQHIGAYIVKAHDKAVTFLDIPGHEAFTAMRARGAKITDVVVLVVAADDGVMPQTVEAINHATAAGVPIIVAVNKIDKPGANVERVKHALAEHNLIPEAWGGQTIFVEVSAKQKVGLETLLEMILLQAEVLELKANPHRSAKGTVIEAKLDKGRGPVATVLVQSGTLEVGDALLVGAFSGRVRALLTDTGEKLLRARPSVPVEVIGLPGVPAAGDQFVVVQDERAAREIAQTRQQKQRTAELAAGSARVTLDDLFSSIKAGVVKELTLVIKADVQGSAEALTEAVERLSTPAVKLKVLHRGVGGITETDVMLASSSGAIIIGFNVRPEPKAAAVAQHQGVDLRLYAVIYDVVADIKAAMEGLLEPILKERSLGRAEVRQLFTIPKVGAIAGCYVLDGSMSRASAGVRVVRDHTTVYEGKLGSLRRFKDDVKEVQQGYECGIGVEHFKDLKIGDILEVYVYDKVTEKL